MPSFSQTEYCIPIEDARRIFEMAIGKVISDSMLVNREERIIHLEDFVDDQKQEYEKLLKVSADRGKEQNIIIDNVYQIVESYKKQLKYQKKKTLWANVKLYSALVALVVVTYIAVK